MDGAGAAASGAEILIAPSASAADLLAAPDGVPVAEHWKILNQHGAVAMQSFVVFVNRVGPEMDPDTGEIKTFWGGSCVVGPDGRLRSRPLDDQPGTSIAELDLREVHVGRKKLPILPDYRLRTLAPLTAERDLPAPLGETTIPEPA